MSTAQGNRSGAGAPPLPDRIKACRVHRFGPPDVIVLEDIAPPEPGPGEVLVRVAAAGVGLWDGWIRAGNSALPQPLPLTLGSDLAGEVAAIGTDVEGLSIGDAVFGVTNERFTGACAEYAVVKAAMIAPKPAAIDDVDAAAVPVIAVTAWQALFDQARLSAGQTVVIHGAGGSVGALAVQFARQAGLKVIATSRGDAAAYVRCIGAERVVNTDKERFEDVASGVDAVIDLVGGDLQQRSFAVLAPGGHLISAVSQPDQDEAARRGITARFFLVDVKRPLLARIGALLAAGRLPVQVGAVLPLAGIRTAHAMLEGTQAHPRGKIVLRVKSA